MSYPNDSPPSTVSGIDVSHYQQKIDWRAVTGAGIQFCFIKATEGAEDVDSCFRRHWEDAGAAGLIRGAYHFFRPQIPITAQADLLVKTIGPLQAGDLPPALDLEGTAGWVDIPLSDRSALVLNLLEEVELRLHATPFVYMSPWFATDVLKSSSAMAQLPIWIAQYTREPSPVVPPPWNTWAFWQHSQSGILPGISGAVDLDRFQGSLEDLKKLALARNDSLKLNVT